jgi:hypothetical protein
MVKSPGDVAIHPVSGFPVLLPVVQFSASAVLVSPSEGSAVLATSSRLSIGDKKNPRAKYSARVRGVSCTQSDGPLLTYLL